MKDPYLLHVFAPTRYVSPFDINMAYEAHYDLAIDMLEAARKAMVLPFAVSVLAHSELVFNTAKAGVRLLSAEILAHTVGLRGAVDANAVPPAGIEGIKLKNNSASLATADGKSRGIGALAVGDVKYRAHTGLLTRMYEASEPVYLAHDEAFALARAPVQASGDR